MKYLYELQFSDSLKDRENYALFANAISLLLKIDIKSYKTDDPIIFTNDIETEENKLSIQTMSDKLPFIKFANLIKNKSHKLCYAVLKRIIAFLNKK